MSMGKLMRWNPTAWAWLAARLNAAAANRPDTRLRETAMRSGTANKRDADFTKQDMGQT